MEHNFEIDNNGDKIWTINGKLHRDGDLPAKVCVTGTKRWYCNGKLHRDGDLPAVEYEHGTKLWYRNGMKHRDGDFASAECSNGDKMWVKNDQMHRIDILPAAIISGVSHWFKYDIEYSLEKLIAYYLKLAHFGRLSLGKIRINRLKHKRWIHGELLCKPPRGNFLGGQNYHKMVSYFTKLASTSRRNMDCKLVNL